MRSSAQHNRSTDHPSDADESVDVPEDDALSASDEELFETFRVSCPDCAQPIAVFADDETLPEHALCPTPWNPFGLTVCRGAGRAVQEAAPLDGDEVAEVQSLGTLLTLPVGLDWRKQPFSHVGGPGSRPVRVPHLRAA